jgi:hypothetical protein
LIGFPDRTVLIPGGKVIFIEFKKPGGRASPQQLKWLATLKGFGFETLLTDNLEEAKRFLDKCLNM